MGGRLPLRLLARAAPFLALHIQATLAASATPLPPCELALQMHTELAFDGAHLTLVGFCGAILAFSGAQNRVMLPSEEISVLSRPKSRQSILSSVPSCGARDRKRPRATSRRQQYNAPQLSSAAAMSVSDTVSNNSSIDSDEEANKEESSSAQQSQLLRSVNWYDGTDGVNSSVCQLDTLFARWPWLPALLQTVPASVVKSAMAYLQSFRFDSAPPGPRPIYSELLLLYHRFLCGLNIPALLLASVGAGGTEVVCTAHDGKRRPGMQKAGHKVCGEKHCNPPALSTVMHKLRQCTGPPNFIAANDGWLRALGIVPADMQRLEMMDPDIDAEGSLHWIWPNQLGRYVRSAAEARLQQDGDCARAQNAWELPIVAKRTVRSVLPGGMSSAEWARTAGNQAHPAAASYSQVHGFQSIHRESSPAGHIVSDVVYLSDFVHQRVPVAVHCVHTALGEVEAVLELLPYQASNSAAGAQQRQIGSTGSSIRAALESKGMPEVDPTQGSVAEQNLHQWVDMWTWFSLRQRMAMLLAPEADMVLQARIGCCRSRGGSEQPRSSSSQRSWLCATSTHESAVSSELLL
jgi:hypothetical protein